MSCTIHRFFVTKKKKKTFELIILYQVYTMSVTHILIECTQTYGVTLYI